MKVIKKPSSRGSGGSSSGNNNNNKNKDNVGGENSSSSSSSSSNNNNNINLYQDIPTIEVSLDDFEEFALDRLKVRGVCMYVMRMPGRIIIIIYYGADLWRC